MELFRYGAAGAERPAVRDDAGRTFDASPLTADYDGRFLADDGIGRLRAALGAGQLPEVDVTGQRIGPSIAQPPAVVCIGMNYAAHAAESGAAPPEQPVVFFKHPSSVVGPDDPIIVPPGSKRTDWEVELGVVIGKTPRYLAEGADVSEYIAGYVLVDDVSEREWQLEISGGQWSKGKCAASFNPLGPVLRPADELDAGNLRLRTWVNGELRQDSSTADMVFSVPELIVSLSNYMQLLPGDVINTGTPQGVALSGRFPYLQAGDRVEMEIEGLGRQRSSVIDYDPAAPTA